ARSANMYDRSMVWSKISFFFLSVHRPPESILFPYTTLFRSRIIWQRKRKGGVAFGHRLTDVQFAQAGSSLFDLLRGQTGEIEQRSEEHTSELQSPCKLVCRLLLEKKKKRTYPDHLSTFQTAR